MKTKLTLVFFFAATVLSFGQKKFNADQQKTIDLLQSKRKDFKASKNDSLYIVENSDQGYFLTTITCGDQAEDIEEQIFNAKPGDIVGPFDGENTFYMLKIKSIDSLQRTKAKLVSFFPRGEYTADTAKFSKLVEKYIDHIKKGKEYSKMVLKDEASIGVRNKGITSYWYGQTKKENYDLVIDRKINEPYVKRVGNEIQVLYITEEKRSAPYKAKAVALVKKVTK